MIEQSWRLPRSAASKKGVVPVYTSLPSLTTTLSDSVGSASCSSRNTVTSYFWL